jgi:hypothetical protein
MCDTTVTLIRRTSRTLTSATGSLLLERLLSTTADLTTVLRLV